MRFKWEPAKAQRNQERYQITFAEVVEAFFDLKVLIYVQAES